MLGGYGAAVAVCALWTLSKYWGLYQLTIPSNYFHSYFQCTKMLQFRYREETLYCLPKPALLLLPAKAEENLHTEIIMPVFK